MAHNTKKIRYITSPQNTKKIRDITPPHIVWHITPRKVGTPHHITTPRKLGTAHHHTTPRKDSLHWLLYKLSNPNLVSTNTEESNS